MLLVENKVIQNKRKNRKGKVTPARGNHQE